MASSIVTASIIDAWKEGTTVDAIKAVQAKIEIVAQSLDVVIHLRFGNDEANRRNSVSEAYKDADAFKTFLLEVGKEAVRCPSFSHSSTRFRAPSSSRGHRRTGQDRRRRRHVQSHVARCGALLLLLVASFDSMSKRCFGA